MEQISNEWMVSEYIFEYFYRILLLLNLFYFNSFHVIYRRLNLNREQNILYSIVI